MRVCGRCIVDRHDPHCGTQQTRRRSALGFHFSKKPPSASCPTPTLSLNPKRKKPKRQARVGCSCFLSCFLGAKRRAQRAPSMGASVRALFLSLLVYVEGRRVVEATESRWCLLGRQPRFRSWAPAIGQIIASEGRENVTVRAFKAG